MTSALLHLCQNWRATCGGSPRASVVWRKIVQAARGWSWQLAVGREVTHQTGDSMIRRFELGLPIHFPPKKPPEAGLGGQLIRPWWDREEEWPDAGDDLTMTRARPRRCSERNTAFSRCERTSNVPTSGAPRWLYPGVRKGQKTGMFEVRSCLARPREITLP